jgi:ComF family protein
MVGWRDEAVGKLAERYKYDPVHALARPLAELLDDTLPYLPEDTLVVPVPTNAKHIRQRGLDHTKRLAKELGRIRGWKCEELVSRVKNTVQVGASKSERSRQAKETFTLSGVVKSNATYLVVDDIWTTGATICSVCKLLKDAGAETVFVGVLARSRNEE